MKGYCQSFISSEPLVFFQNPTDVDWHLYQKFTEDRDEREAPEQEVVRQTSYTYPIGLWMQYLFLPFVGSSGYEDDHF